MMKRATADGRRLIIASGFDSHRHHWGNAKSRAARHATAEWNRFRRMRERRDAEPNPHFTGWPPPDGWPDPTADTA